MHYFVVAWVFDSKQNQSKQCKWKTTRCNGLQSRIRLRLDKPSHTKNISRLTKMMHDTYPEWMTEEALHTLSAGYLLPGETPRDMMMRLATTAAKINQDPTLEEDLFHCLWAGWLGAASPVCSNFGTNRGLPISCFSVHLSDSVSSIYSHLKETASLSKNG